MPKTTRKTPDASTDDVVKALAAHGVKKQNVWQARKGAAARITSAQVKVAVRLLQSAGGEAEAVEQIEAASEAAELLAIVPGDRFHR